MKNNHLTPGVEPEDKGNQISLHYILQPDWTLLLLVNIKGSLHCKQNMLLVNIQVSLYCKKVACKNYNYVLVVSIRLQLLVSI